MRMFWTNAVSPRQRATEEIANIAPVRLRQSNELVAMCPSLSSDLPPRLSLTCFVVRDRNQPVAEELLPPEQMVEPTTGQAIDFRAELKALLNSIMANYGQFMEMLVRCVQIPSSVQGVRPYSGTCRTARLDTKNPGRPTAVETANTRSCPVFPPGGVVRGLRWTDVVH